MVSTRATPKITFSQHALEQLADRGATAEEVVQAIRLGEMRSAKKGRCSFHRKFPFENKWKWRYYVFKEVVPIVAIEADEYIVVTAYVFFGGNDHEDQL